MRSSQCKLNYPTFLSIKKGLEIYSNPLLSIFFH
nr:MAG TPA: hypothetical protein [Caudoviricetes sp.]